MTNPEQKEWMATREKGPIMARILRKIAPRIGAEVVIEPLWGIVGQIVFKSGRKRYFRFSSIDLNPLGATEIAKDKDYANFFLARMKYSTIPGKTFFSKEWAKQVRSPRDIDAAYKYAQRIGMPVIVKPNSASQGKGVALVHTKKDFFRRMREIFRIDRVALVQKPVFGSDYRIVVLDDRVISAYQRIPLNVIGNGKSTIKQLLRQKQRLFNSVGRDTCLKADDSRMFAKLKRTGRGLDSIVAKDERVYLLDNANLSAGGDSLDVTGTMHADYKKLAVQITKDMGLRLCGVDLMVQGNITEPLGTYWVIEINAAPGLDHYATVGKEQEKIVEDLYLEVLKSMDRD